MTPGGEYTGWYGPGSMGNKNEGRKCPAKRLISCVKASGTVSGLSGFLSPSPYPGSKAMPTKLFNERRVTASQSIDSGASSSTPSSNAELLQLEARDLAYPPSYRYQRQRAEAGAEDLSQLF